MFDKVRGGKKITVSRSVPKTKYFARYANLFIVQIYPERLERGGPC